MNRLASFINVIFWPIYKVLGWLLKHRCKLDALGCCLNEYCGKGKEGVDGWGQSNDRWVRRQPLPKKPLSRNLYPYKDGYTHDKRLADRFSASEINDMLRQGYQRARAQELEIARLFREAREADTGDGYYIPPNHSSMFLAIQADAESHTQIVDASGGCAIPDHIWCGCIMNTGTVDKEPRIRSYSYLTGGANVTIRSNKDHDFSDVTIVVNGEKLVL